MADQKISELTALTGANLADVDAFAVVDTSAVQTKKITYGELKAALDTGTGFVRITGDTMTGALGITQTGSASTIPLSVTSNLNSGLPILELRSTGNSNSTIDLRADGTGDPRILFDLNGATLFAIGIDNSDGDKFKISGHHQLGTNPRLTIDAAGNSTFGGSVTANGLVLGTNTGIYQTDATISNYSSSNGVYINGNASGWLRLNGDGTGRTRLDLFGGTSGSANFVTGNTNSLNIASNGDISFYNDSAAQGLYWDSSTSRLGLGTTAPSSTLHVSGTANTTGKFAVLSSGVHPSFDFYNQGTSYFNGATTVDDNLTVTGASTFSGAISLNDGTDNFNIGVTTNKLTIKSTTSDGSDDTSILIDAGSAGESSSRGSYIEVHGNETASDAGKVIYQMGNVTGSMHEFRKAGGTTAAVIDASGRVGINSVPNTSWRNDASDTVLQLGTEATLHSDANVTTELWNNAYVNNSDQYKNISTRGSSRYMQYEGNHRFFTAASASAGSTISMSERARITSDGNLFLGTTINVFSAADSYGYNFYSNGQANYSIDGTSASASVLYLNRENGDGVFTKFYKDRAEVGAIGVSGGNNLYISSSQTNHAGLTFATDAILPTRQGATTNGVTDLGASSEKFKDLHLSGTANVAQIDITENTNARVYSSDGIGEVGSGNFAFQAVNAAGNALKPFGFRGEDLRFATALEAMRIMNSGNVGINSTNPQVKLQVNDSGTAASTSGYGTGFNVARSDGLIGMTMGYTSANNSTYIQGRNFTNTDTQPIAINPLGGNVGIGTSSPRRQIHLHNTASATTKFMITNGATGESNDAQGFQIGIDSSGNAVLENRENTNLTLYTNNSPRLTIDNSGNSTFGGTVTAGGLSIENTSGISGMNIKAATNNIAYIDFGDSDDSNIGGINYSNVDDTLNFRTGNSNKVTLDASGNLGIGLVPTHKLHVNGTVKVTGTQTFDVDSGGGSYIAVSHTGNESWTWDARSGSGSDDYLDVGISGGTRAMSWHETGRVGIGTASPSTKLDVKGSVNFSVNTTSHETFVFTTQAADDAKLMMKNASSVTAVQLSANGDTFFNGGNVLVGSTSNVLGSRAFIESEGSTHVIGARVGANGHYALGAINAAGTVVGGVVVNASSTTYATSSDYRLKENVSYTWDATTRLKQLKPARFNWIADSNNTVQDGFLAHEVSSVVPEAVFGNKDAEIQENGDGYQSLDYSKLVPLLVKTIQELEARITALEA